MPLHQRAADGAARTDRILVIGATGRTGRLLARTLTERGCGVRALVADISRARTILPGQVALVAGRVQDGPAVREAVSGAAAVVFTAAGFGSAGESPRDVDHLGVEGVVEAARTAGVRRFVLLSSAGVTQPEHPHNIAFQNVLKWKRRGEEAVRASGLAYTVVRALGLRDRDGGAHGVRMVQGDRIAYGEDIARGDVASFLADTVLTPMSPEDGGFAEDFDVSSLIGATIEIYNDARLPGGRWASSQPSLLPDVHPPAKTSVP